MKKTVLMAAFTLLWGCTTSATDTPATVSTAEDGWDFNQTPAQLTTLCNETLDTAKSAFAQIESDTSPATVQSVYGPYNAMGIGLQDIQHIWYVKSVHPDTNVQAAAEACINAYIDFATTIELSQPFYQRVASIDVTGLNPSEQLMIENRLRAFRKSGVDRDEPTRQRVRALIAEITELGTAFDKNIRTDSKIIVTNAEELKGLPEDFIASHPADADGNIEISTDYPDLFPVLTYSESDDLRLRLYTASKAIATPANDTTLRQLIEKRHELANLLGYPSHAALAMDGLMIGTPENAQRFIDEIGDAVREPASKDMAILLQRLQQIDPAATGVEVWQSFYLSNLVRQEQYAIDAREVRQYFHFDRVQRGIFAMTEQLFDVEIVPWQTNTWHEDVTAWELRDNGKPLGRFYLDMHPRKNKYKHAAHWTLRTGLKDGPIAMSGMVMNFPQGLMEHNQVETFLHEFGHLLHNMFSGSQQWLDISGMTMERDFVEAPSQMLEEWVWDYDTLKTFATNDAGEVIPRSLVEKMVAARHFGEAAGTAQQLFYANLALNYYNRPPDSFALLPLLKDMQARYSPYPYVPDTYFYNNFTHLNGYSSNYYIYQWSKAISTDLFSQFAAAGMNDAKTASDYRRKILEPGGSKPASELIADFLQRPFSPDTYKTYLKKLN
ncbi:MAG: Zn-dependent oligopeptidase [Gammaproteobacteria bacterium]|nr:Zn-dependent oligopeptidase [Gammaproteobacteria bacterium]